VMMVMAWVVVTTHRDRSIARKMYLKIYILR
jgi:hypothetical protein